jgi:hypothetical protein
MARKHVVFTGHKTVKRPTEVSFTKKDGALVDFEADKKVKIPVRVEFDANKK